MEQSRVCVAAADQLTNCFLLLFSHALTLGITESMVIVKNERSEPCHVMPSPPTTDAWCRGGTSFQRLLTHGLIWISCEYR
ncbi:MAG: hypothetical protein J3Q66DRAFT_353439 [Benniella sp.]|nr:MAG: hypothetical protein J3Q66DRAFT_353439 [Benniella sp.]